MAALYVHIPFCGSKCVYCDFYSLVHHESDIDAYISAVLREAERRRGEIATPYRTLYIGGGTPSLLSGHQLRTLVDGLHAIFDLSHVEEFTIEVNPDDVVSQRYHPEGEILPNRVSMGVQSFVDAELQFMGRRHQARQAVEAVHMLRDAGIKNMSIDLIYGVPGQSLASWQSTVQQALDLGVQHISAYSMMYEQGTRLWVMRSQGKVREIDEEESVAMYNYLVRMLNHAGYCHYETSNFALPGYESRHNSSYWNLTPYLGLGAAAHSFDGTTRRYNPNSLKAYMAGTCGLEEERLEPWERYDEYVMLRMRTSEGLNLKAMRAVGGLERYCDYFEQKAQGLVQRGWLQERGGCYSIPESQVIILDAIIRELMWDN